MWICLEEISLERSWCTRWGVSRILEGAGGGYENDAGCIESKKNKPRRCQVVNTRRVERVDIQLANGVVYLTHHPMFFDLQATDCVYRLYGATSMSV